MLYIWFQHSTTVTLERWLGKVLAILLLLISQGKEEVVLARLEELELCLPPLGLQYGPTERHDPLNVVATMPKCKQLPPEKIMARLVNLLQQFWIENCICTNLFFAAFLCRKAYLSWSFINYFWHITSRREEVCMEYEIMNRKG